MIAVIGRSERLVNQDSRHWPPGTSTNRSSSFLGIFLLFCSLSLSLFKPERWVRFPDEGGHRRGGGGREGGEDGGGGFPLLDDIQKPQRSHQVKFNVLPAQIHIIRSMFISGNSSAYSFPPLSPNVVVNVCLLDEAIANSG